MSDCQTKVDSVFKVVQNMFQSMKMRNTRIVHKYTNLLNCI